MDLFEKSTVIVDDMGALKKSPLNLWRLSMSILIVLDG